MAQNDIIFPSSVPVDAGETATTPAPTSVDPFQLREGVSLGSTVIQAMELSQKGRAEYWSYKLYSGRDNAKVKVHYCTRHLETEFVARMFINEPVLGLDLEWRPRYRPGIKNNVSVIQLASETQIAIFHLALHYGTTSEQLLPPSLRKILESSNIIKTGVNIVGADGSRLKKYFRIQPKGLFELSNLHRILQTEDDAKTHGRGKLVALSKLVDIHLGLPLLKDNSIRCSDWSKACQLNEAQKDYAASDAYAGYQLFRVMDAKRRKLEPVIPLPACDQPRDYAARQQPKKDSEKAEDGETVKGKGKKRDLTNAITDAATTEDAENPCPPRSGQKRRFIHPDELTSKNPNVRAPLAPLMDENVS